MLDDTIEELRATALAADDASGYFPAMYAQVTERIRATVADGGFADPARMVEFAETFAGWYLRPRAGSTPIPTQIGCPLATAALATSANASPRHVT